MLALRRPAFSAVYPWPRPLAVQRHITRAVTFDAGQTLIDLDLDFLAARLGERGVHADPAVLGLATPAAWTHYDQLVESGADHITGWKGFIGRVLEGGGIRDAALVDWLYTENRPRNLWRRPIAGMVELARELRGRGVRVAVLSNSEGMLEELLVEIGLAEAFDTIIDSGRVKLEKPGREIFDHTLAALGVHAADAVHIGDSFNADIVGARGAGWRAIWFGRRIAPPGTAGRPPIDDPGVAIARDAGEVRAALRRWNVT